MKKIDVVLRGKIYNKIVDSEITLEQQDESIEFFSDDIIEDEQVVYSDMYYEVYCNDFKSEKIKSIRIYINDYLLPSVHNADKIEFRSEMYRNGKVFRDCYGYVKISLELTVNSEFDNEENYVFKSKSIPVCVRPNEEHDSLKKMLKYVYNNYEDLLYNDITNSYLNNEMKAGNNQGIEMQIHALKQITITYGELYSYFRSQAKIKIDQTETVDSFEKIKHISHNTIKYISCHPELLSQSDYYTGIKYNGMNLIPYKTLILSNRTSKDIYENQIIVSFLEFLNSKVKDLIQSVKNVNINKKVRLNVDKEYILSNEFLSSEIRSKLNVYLKELVDIENKISSLYLEYRDILSVSKINIYEKPKPTSAFINIPQYRRVYDCISKWFDYGAYDLSKEKHMLAFLMAHQLYEYYILLKIKDYFISIGYETNECNAYFYTMKRNSLYKNTKFNNTFKLKYKECDVTIYFQPVISTGIENGIGLYRNTSIMFSSDGKNNKGRYYTPDYVLKIKMGHKIKYLILDAKYTTEDTIKKYIVPEVAFKYLVSISEVDENEELVGVYLINGKSKGIDELVPIYDKEKGKKISPTFSIVNMTENDENLDDTHINLFEKIIGFILEENI